MDGSTSKEMEIKLTNVSKARSQRSWREDKT